MVDLDGFSKSYTILSVMGPWIGLVGGSPFPFLNLVDFLYLWFARFRHHPRHFIPSFNAEESVEYTQFTLVWCNWKGEPSNWAGPLTSLEMMVSGKTQLQLSFLELFNTLD